MKIRIMVAFMAIAALIFLSCNWFRTKKKESSNPLVGEWKLDSIKAGKDSNAVQIFIAAAMKDPDLSFLFTKDSILLIQEIQLKPLVILLMKKKSN